MDLMNSEFVQCSHILVHFFDTRFAVLHFLGVSFVWRLQ